MMASQLWRSSDWCQMNSTGFWRTWPMAWKASWSQLDPGKTTTPNFMGTSGKWRGKIYFSTEKRSSPQRRRGRREREGAARGLAGARFIVPLHKNGGLGLATFLVGLLYGGMGGGGREFAAFFRGPVGLGGLAAAGYAEGIGGDVFGDDGAGGDVGAVAQL